MTGRTSTGKASSDFAPAVGSTHPHADGCRHTPDRRRCRGEDKADTADHHVGAGGSTYDIAGVFGDGRLGGDGNGSLDSDGVGDEQQQRLEAEQARAMLWMTPTLVEQIWERP